MKVLKAFWSFASYVVQPHTSVPYITLELDYGTECRSFVAFHWYLKCLPRTHTNTHRWQKDPPPKSLPVALLTMQVIWMMLVPRESDFLARPPSE